MANATVGLALAGKDGSSSVVRIGGDSTDWSWWPVPHTKTPPGIRYTLTPQWMQITKAFVNGTHARLIVGINLEANNRRLASVEAHALVSGLGASAIRALEIGNEPELYGSFGWYRTASGHEVPGRPRGYAPTNFEDDFSSFAKSMPRVPLAGPSTGSPTWLPTLGQFLAREPKVAVATVHAYPLKHCVATNHVTIGQVLGDASSDGLAARVAPLAAVAHRHHVPLRIDEINSVSCGGEPGVSDTYATALWSLDTLFALARAGVDGVNIHTGQGHLGGVRAPQLLRVVDVCPGDSPGVEAAPHLRVRRRRPLDVGHDRARSHEARRGDQQADRWFAARGGPRTRPSWQRHA